MSSTINAKNNENMTDMRLIISDDFSDDECCEELVVKHGVTEIPWIEKYRPKKLDEIVDQQEIIKILKNAIKTGELQHLLLHGPAGTGKTSTILAMINELFTPAQISDCVLELNASDDRGINIVRENIKSFSKRSLGVSESSSLKFKIIILDEIDSMTKDAQAALRTLMEKTSRITRFCFMCNYNDKIIEPIKSRCSVLRFNPIQDSSLFAKLKQIAEHENLNVSDECINTLVSISGGDARRGIMQLQKLQYIQKIVKNVTPRDIIKMNGDIIIDEFPNFWEICSKGSIQDVYNLNNTLCRCGYAINSILNLLMNSLLNNNIDERTKANIFIELSKTDMKLSRGCFEHLQLLNILVFVNSSIKDIPKNIIKSTVDETPKKRSKSVPKESTEETSKKRSKSVPKESTEETSKKRSKSVPKESTENTPKKRSERLIRVK